MSKNIYEMVTERIIEKLENGVIPWRMPFQQGMAVNWNTGKPYRGINAMLLESGEYATFKQIKDAGGKVKKGEKSQMVVFWKLMDIEDDESEKDKKIPLMRFYNVFEINKQVEGLKSKREIISEEHDPITECEKIIEDYIMKPQVKYKSGRAFYSPSMDYVSVPPLKDYKSAEEYYGVLFHELLHSTGHVSRLKRIGVQIGNVSFGSETYSKEELIAEIGSAMLCTVTKIDHVTIDNSASYINGWLRKLKDDKKFIIQASANAQKAVDYIQGTTL